MSLSLTEYPVEVVGKHMSTSEFVVRVSIVCQFTVKEISWIYIKRLDFIEITGMF